MKKLIYIIATTMLFISSCQKEPDNILYKMKGTWVIYSLVDDQGNETLATNQEKANSDITFFDLDADNKDGKYKFLTEYNNQLIEMNVDFRIISTADEDIMDIEMLNAENVFVDVEKDLLKIQPVSSSAFFYYSSKD